MPQGNLLLGLGDHFVPVLEFSATSVHEASQHDPPQLLVLVGNVILHDVETYAVSVDFLRVDGECEALVEDKVGGGRSLRRRR